MVTLRKFYDLLHKSVTVTLCDPKLTETFYEGPVSRIPEIYEDCRVLDFSMNDYGDMLFEIEKEAEA